MAEEKKTEQLSTVVKAMTVVELVAAEGKLNLTQISQKLEIGLTASHRLVHTLAGRGWLNKNPDMSYQLGPRLLGVMATMHESLNIGELVRPVLTDLWERTGETIHLTKLEGRSIVYLDQLISPRPVHSVSIVGGRSPAHCVSPGLSQIATQSSEYVDWFVSKPLKQYTPNTITSVDEFRGALRDIRDVGYAVNLGGYREDVGGVSVAVTRPDGKAIVGLSVCAPVYRLASSDKEHIGELLRAAAARVERILVEQNISTVR